MIWVRNNMLVNGKGRVGITIRIQIGIITRDRERI